jgi:EAL domain-containing protein (putative c-di-GMP-specific phosphodiesterase class I)
MFERRSDLEIAEPPCAAGSSNWFLCEKADSGALARTVNVHVSPFQIGRLPNLTLCLPDRGISKLHAELVLQGRKLSVRDLGSTNGTFVNGRRISDPTPLSHGDLLQLATIVFRLDYRNMDPCSQTIRESATGWAHSLCQFDRLMSERAVVPHFQPIVNLRDSSRIGFEALGRSGLEGLEQPQSMFAAAGRLDQQAALSRLLRWEGVRVGGGLPTGLNLFVNTHPTEIITVELMASLRELREKFPVQRLTVEIHEAAVTDIDALIEFRAFLRDLKMQLAFDDFGSGQARLIELTETSPDFVKFDMKLIRGIHEASARRQRMLASLVRLVRELGIATVAEGVELADEAAVCSQLGFELAQGFYFGRPAPLTQWIA